MYIDGVWRTGSDAETADDLNPATGQVFAKVAQAGAADVEDAIAAAHRASVAWGKMLAGQREALLLDAATLIAEKKDEIVDLLIAETGSTLLKAPWEVGYAVECLRSAAACIRHAHGDTYPMSTAGQIGMTIRQPLGVVAGIAPFNSPLLLSMKKIAFALAAGNTFVLCDSGFGRDRWRETRLRPASADDHLHRFLPGGQEDRRRSGQAHETRHA
jgi:aldehyde dehydrogenase (NAD+)